MALVGIRWIGEMYVNWTFRAPQGADQPTKPGTHQRQPVTHQQPAIGFFPVWYLVPGTCSYVPDTRYRYLVPGNRYQVPGANQYGHSSTSACHPAETCSPKPWRPRTWKWIPDKRYLVPGADQVHSSISPSSNLLTTATGFIPFFDRGP